MKLATLSFGLAALVAALLMVGCGGGGGGGGSVFSGVLDTSKTNVRADDSPQQHVQYMVNGSDDVKSISINADVIDDILGAETAGEILSGFGLPATNAELYGGRSVSAPSRKGADALALRAYLWARHNATPADGRASEPIDYTDPKTGIHWTGTYAESGDDDNGAISLQVTGDAPDTTITISISISWSGNTASGSIHVAGTGKTLEGDTVGILISASVSGQYTETASTETDAITIEVNAELTLNGGVVLRQTMTVTVTGNYQTGTTSGTLSATGESYVFAEDGYWVHTKLTMNATFGDTTTSSGSMTFSDCDGYVLTLNLSGAGTFTHNGEKIADVTVAQDGTSFTITYLAGGSDTIPIPSLVPEM
ncbi:MAG TPA: hypothetical protein PLZ36_07120 [Armatimonadota bacterium]|nr:hypothetical protein [Armatimonadota bacterium]